MKYTVYNPGKNLSRYVRCYWSLVGNDTSKPEKERVFPDGCIELIFHFGDRFKKYQNEPSALVQPKCFIHGQLKKYMDLERTGTVGIFSARFHPWGLQPFVNFPVHRITGTTLSVGKVWPKEGPALARKITQAKTDKERIAILEKFFSAKIRGEDWAVRVAETCVTEIIRSQGNVQLDALAAKTGTGMRSLERTFSSTVGLSPKLFCRIVRFNNALQLIEKRDFRSFTSVAHDGGFYDQAHFIKDFKALTGLNPKKYFSENLDMVKFFNL